MQWPYRWDLLLRYRLIEIVSQWEGRLTTNHLCNAFGIGRQQASKDINSYLKNIAANNLQYDKSLKGYIPTKNFTPKLTTGTAQEYLQLLSRNKDISHTFEGLDLGLSQSEILQLPIRHIEPKILRPLVQAAREQRRVEIEYVSLSNPLTERRIIAPHTLVCTPLRWHIRAYCEKNQDYRDFVLSRFRGESQLLHVTTNLKALDTHWNKTITLVLKPDPRLNAAQQMVIAHDYAMSNQRLEIKTRACLVHYCLRILNINPMQQMLKAEAQQLVIANMKEIEVYLF